MLRSYPESKQNIDSWLARPAKRLRADSTVLSLFDQIVSTVPDRQAVVFEGNSFSFLELDSRSNYLARKLIAEGIKREQRVGICVDRSLAAIAAMLACMKAGAAFVPLDPDMPAARIKDIAVDAEIKQVLCGDNYLELFNDSSLIVHSLEQLNSINFLNCAAPDPKPQPEDLAYIMYTSGSTGKPKGVEIEHGALLTYVLADIEAFQVSPFDSCLQFSSLCFDLVIEEIFPQLLCGATVVVRPRKRPTEAIELSALIESGQISIVHIATAYWHEWVDLMRALKETVPECLRLLVVTGEKVSVTHYHRWLKLTTKPVLFANAYGPTEATVSSTVFFPTSSFARQSMPIGKALPGYKAFILDSHLMPVPKGEEGLLYIAGAALARGYHKRPELTKEVFIDVATRKDLAADRLYKTGDLVVELADGNIDYIGRLDNQIKIGSYRVEPQEIENQILSINNVDEAFIRAEECQGLKSLVAYIASKDRSLSVKKIEEHLKTNLPSYMQPSRYCVLEALPKTINGKIDWKELASRVDSANLAEKQEIFSENVIESKIANIWSKILNNNQFALSDDFFVIGGSSILALRVITRISQEFKIRLTIEDILRNSSVESLAKVIEDKAGNFKNKNVPLVYQHSEAFFFTADARQLYGVYHPPAKSRDDEGALLICPPLGQEYERSHWSIRQLALKLSAAGYHVLRFDYSGTGDSAGDFENIRLRDLKTDIKAAYAKLIQLSGHKYIDILGIRIGGTLAAGLQEKLNINRLVCWDAFFSPAAYLSEIQNSARQLLTESNYNFVDSSGNLNLNGYCYSKDFLKDLEDSNKFLSEFCPAIVYILESESTTVDFNSEEQKNSYSYQSISTYIDWNDLEPQKGAVFLLQAFIHKTLHLLGLEK